MKNYLKIIFLTYFLLSIQLIVSNNLFIIVIFFFIINFYFLKKRKEQKVLNKITFIELIGWFINTYIVLLNDISLWFLALCNLIWLLTSIKIIEARNFICVKNSVIFLFISIGTSSLFNQNIYFNLIYLLSSFLLIYSLLILNSFEETRIFKQLIILISFIPLTFITYIYLPKINPWLNLNPNLISQTGLNNKLKPGDISSLVQNEELVGRVFFENEIPKPSKRYWRVFVLDRFENNIWYETQFNNKIYEKEDLISVNKKNPELNNFENWILEPNYKRNLPWSGEGYPNIKKLDVSSEGILLANEPVKKKIQYKIIKNKSYWRNNFPKLTDKNIDKGQNKLLNEIGQKWANESSSREEIISKAEYFFRNNGFKYTISPGLMNKKNPYDDFLFKKKSGFCEHYAGSFSLLMRAANIPSRVVVGYQGGQILKNINEENYLLIDNSYAHAWSEIWLEDIGWKRIDPTEWVARERIHNSNLIFKKKNLFKKISGNLRVVFYNNFPNFEIGLNNFLNQINLKLNPIIFSKNIIINRLVTFGLFIISLIISVNLILFKNKPNHNKDIFKLSICLYLNVLGSYKYKIKSGETLKHFSKKLALEFPSISTNIFRISNLYNNLRFNEPKANIKIFSLLLYLLALEIKVLIYILFNSKTST